jgi:hypothetical protein
VFSLGTPDSAQRKQQLRCTLLLSKQDVPRDLHAVALGTVPGTAMCQCSFVGAMRS